MGIGKIGSGLRVVLSGALLTWVGCAADTSDLAVLFGEVNGTFSDAAYKISKRAKPILFNQGWQKIFEMDDIREQVRDITGSKK